MPHDAATLDRTIRRLNRPGQRRIHFTKESDASKPKLISEVMKLGLTVVVYQVKGQPDRAARPLCINALVDDLVTAGCAHLILERDASIEKADRQMIAAALDRNGGYALRYEHTAPNDHALLWISDMVAGCCHKGGEWHRRVQPMIAGIRTLAP